MAKEVIFSVALVCLSVCKQHYSKRYKWIAMKFSGGDHKGSTRKNCLNFSDNPASLRWVNEQKIIIIMACPDRGAVNDPKPLT